jgi:hypothetical protein
MRASQNVMMLVKVEHLKAAKLLRDLFDFLLLARLFGLDARRVPANVFGHADPRCDRW